MLKSIFPTLQAVILGLMLTLAAQLHAISLEQAVSRAKAANPGRVVGAKTQTVNGRPVHVIRILMSGSRVKTVRIPAK